MDVITMPSMSSLLRRLKDDYPQWSFEASGRFAWSADEATVYYRPEAPYAADLLHETAHAILGHAGYDRDVALLAMERDAWDTAVTLAARYGLTISDDTVQNSLDTYRDWLHARSTCPDCASTGFQTKRAIYICPACAASWRVNEARTCALRRYRTGSAVR